MNAEQKPDKHLPKYILVLTYLNDGSELRLQTWPCHQANVLIFACRPSKRKPLKHSRIPNGWVIGVDPAGGAWEEQEEHYHCEKDGSEIVVTVKGHGSHKTKSGDRIPRKLGDFLREELNIPLEKTDSGYMARFMVKFMVLPSGNISTLQYLKALLNTNVREVWQIPPVMHVLTDQQEKTNANI